MINPDLIVKQFEQEQNTQSNIPYIDILPGASRIQLSKAAASLMGMSISAKSRILVVRDYMTMNSTVIGTTDVSSVQSASDGRYSSALVSPNTMTLRSTKFCEILIHRFSLDPTHVTEKGARFYLRPDEIDGVFLLDVNHINTIDPNEATQHSDNASNGIAQNVPAEAGN